MTIGNFLFLILSNHYALMGKEYSLRTVLGVSKAFIREEISVGEVNTPIKKFMLHYAKI